MIVLGLESSCDETGVAVVDRGRHILSNLVASQASLHAQFGGIVPEVASRQHLRSFVPLLERALAEAGVSPEQLQGVAVASGPGLAGSLLVGVNLAKALAWAWGLPLVGVNHLEAHIYANWLGEEESPVFPCLCLVASGGHTELILMAGHGQYQPLGRTRDDAAGEAFDKVARLLGLGFPGGPAIQALAREAQASVPLPRPLLPQSDDFSFSGLKTAVFRLVQAEADASAWTVPQVAASFQKVVVEVLVTKTLAAAQRHGARQVLLGGGVAANEALRQAFAQRSPLPVRCPPPALCTDNGAIIAAAGFHRLQAGHPPAADWTLDVHPRLPLA